MPTSGPKYGTGSNVTGVGTIAWTNPTNAGADDASNATATLAAGEQSNYLSMQALGFAVSGTIDGITVEIEWSMSGKLSTPAVVDTVVALTRNGTDTIGSNYAIGSDLPITPTVQSFGGAADLWGTAWTAANVNLSTFGVMLSCTNNGAGSRDAQVDFIRVTVDYTAVDVSTIIPLVGNLPFVKRVVQIAAYWLRPRIAAWVWDFFFGKGAVRHAAQVQWAR